MDSYRSMTPDERYRLAVDMSDAVREIALNGLRARHPAVSTETLMRLFIEQVLGLRLPPQSAGGGRQ